ncbi:hypothetical protein UFOVP223_124 [uncultured Caudovirales phage]|uniref:Uncharacterized protein n=1 Tax=uncultured Caudovirales phage TaxID=2100421 RepID=A0A6J7WPP8_9CAUD|nr:hypothetical protein UFOVP110_40 [uncultured Caudovirales phage]CAB5219727.1 hypothetical protein UFOVP223_124 [uncultured Caudovirales phage]
MGINAYDYGKADGVAEERQRIIDWVEEHRTGLELVDGVVMYRDHFDSEFLISFIKGENK